MYWWLDNAIRTVQSCLYVSAVTEPEICSWFTTTFVTTSRRRAPRIEYWLESGVLKGVLQPIEGSPYSAILCEHESKRLVMPPIETFPRAAQIELESGGRVSELKLTDSGVMECFRLMIAFMRMKLSEGTRSFSSYSAEHMEGAALEWNREQQRKRDAELTVLGSHVIHTANGYELVALCNEIALRVAGDHLLNCMRYSAGSYMYSSGSFIGLRLIGTTRYSSLAEVRIADITGDEDRPEVSGRYIFVANHLGVSNVIAPMACSTALYDWINSTGMQNSSFPHDSLIEYKSYRLDKNNALTLTAGPKVDNRRIVNLRRATLQKFLRKELDVGRTAGRVQPPTSIIGPYQFRASVCDPFTTVSQTGMYYMEVDQSTLVLNYRYSPLIVDTKTQNTSAPEVQRGRNTIRELKHRFTAPVRPELVKREPWVYVPWFSDPVLIIPGADAFEVHRPLIEKHLDSTLLRSALLRNGRQLGRSTAQSAVFRYMYGTPRSNELLFEGAPGQRLPYIGVADAYTHFFHRWAEHAREASARQDVRRGELGFMYGMRIIYDHFRPDGNGAA